MEHRDGRRPVVKDFLRYDQMVEAAMRGVVRESLLRAAAKGLPGSHHFYITFKTQVAGVHLSAHLAEQYPDEMTIVIQHQYWELIVGDLDFAITLSFSNKPERLTIPFDAITTFADPSVKFGLQFQVALAPEEAKPAPAKVDPPKLGRPLAVKNAEKPIERIAAKSAAKSADKAGQVVALDSFRKK